MEVENLIHRVVQHDGDHDIYQIIAHQDGGKQFFGHGEQLGHALTAVAILDVVHIIGTQREIGNLAARIKCR